MKYILAYMSLLSFGVCQSNSERNFLIQFEGYSNKVYYVNGIPHVGIGHKLGDSYKSSYTDVEIADFWYEDYRKAKSAVLKLYPEFDKHPENVRLVLISLAYNLGGAGLAKFVKFQSAINQFDYNSAANELIDSLWYLQVGNRAPHHVAIIKGNK